MCHWPCFPPWFLVWGSQGSAMCALCQGWTADTEKLSVASLNLFFSVLSCVSIRVFYHLQFFSHCFLHSCFLHTNLWRFLCSWGLPMCKLASHPPTFPLQLSLLMSFASLPDTLQTLTFHLYLSRARASESTQLTWLWHCSVKYIQVPCRLLTWIKG